MSQYPNHWCWLSGINTATQSPCSFDSILWMFWFVLRGFWSCSLSSAASPSKENPKSILSWLDLNLLYFTSLYFTLLYFTLLYLYCLDFAWFGLTLLYFTLLVLSWLDLSWHLTVSSDRSHAPTLDRTYVLAIVTLWPSRHVHTCRTTNKNLPCSKLIIGSWFGKKKVLQMLKFHLDAAFCNIIRIWYIVTLGVLSWPSDLSFTSFYKNGIGQRYLGE